MSEAVLSTFLYNNTLYNVSEFDRIYVEKNPSVYEVIRIIDGVPLFLEEHYERLINSAKLLGFSFNISIYSLKESIEAMLVNNNIRSYNVKIVINNLDANPNIYFFFIRSSYPANDMYSNGIKTFLYHATRENPNAKVIYKNMRDEINRLLEVNKCYEALLVNEKNEVTEGSRSNLFFIKDNFVYTAPAKDVLLGITRQRIISVCKQNEIEVIERSINTSELSLFDACFISGTSPKVLPIHTIDNHIYQLNNEILLKIMTTYNFEIDKYISNYR